MSSYRKFIFSFAVSAFLVQIGTTLHTSHSEFVLIADRRHTDNHSRSRREVASLTKIRNSGSTKCGRVRVKQRKELSLESVLVSLISASDLNRKRAGLGEFPWIAALIVHTHGQTFYCGGSLIDHWHILTAASCVATLIPEDLKNMKVLLGTYDLYNPYEIHRVEARVAQVAYHKGFDSLNMENNIALIKLTEPIKYSEFIQPICLPTESSDFSDRLATLSGWGQLLFNPLDHLHKLDMRVWNSERCVKRYNAGIAEEKPFPEIRNDSLCAGTPVLRSKSLCQGNNGAPLVTQHSGRFHQIGLVSWGIGADKFPCVFTRISAHSLWIQKGIATLHDA